MPVMPSLWKAEASTFKVILNYVAGFHSLLKLHMRLCL